MDQDAGAAIVINSVLMVGLSRCASLRTLLARPCRQCRSSYALTRVELRKGSVLSAKFRHVRGIAHQQPVIVVFDE